MVQPQPCSNPRAEILKMKPGIASLDHLKVKKWKICSVVESRKEDLDA